MIRDLFSIKHPIIQAGMIWCSPWQLASTVSNCGGLGVIGSGSMYPEVLKKHIKKCKEYTKNTFAVNLPLLYPNIDEHIKIIIDLKVPIVFTSAGSPKLYTSLLKKEGIKVVHVISSTTFAKKSEDAGVDAIVAEGFEAGGHNGIEETTTMCLIPNIVKSVSIPVIAAGGIATGKAMLAAMVLGADGVQIGSRFVASKESSAHINFKQKIIESKEGDTILTMKELTPVRLLKNKFYNKLLEVYRQGFGKEKLQNILGRGRAKKGMYEGDLNDGELEIGQVSAIIDDIKPAEEIFFEIINEFNKAKRELSFHKRYS